MKKKVVLFLPMLIALLDVVIEFAIPTNEVINTNGNTRSLSYSRSVRARCR